MAPKSPLPGEESMGAHFAEYNGVKIQIPKPVGDMTPQDWMRVATGKASPLNKISITHQSFLGLHVVLKDKNYIPIWLKDTHRTDIPQAFDTMERAINMGAELVADLNDIELPVNLKLAADGHIRRDDVILAKVPIVVYYGLKAQEIRRAKGSIEYKSAEGKAFESLGDQPRTIKGNRDIPVYEATEHQVQYQDRPRF